MRELRPRVVAVLSVALASAVAFPSGAPRAFADAAGTWQPLQSYPRARDLHTAVFDPLQLRMTVFGGIDPIINETWQLDPEGSPAWRALIGAGDPPSPRYASASVYDPVRQRMIVCGGAGYSGWQSTLQTYALTLSGTPTWSMIAPVSAPTGRAQLVLTYDSSRDRLVLFGGYDGSWFQHFVYTMDLSGTPTWTLLAPSGTAPSPRNNAVGVYDPEGDRLIVFGGFDGAFLNDVWQLSFAGTPTWTQLSPQGTPPSVRREHAGVLDAAHHRIVYFGGLSGTTFLSDTWALSLDDPPVWTQLSPGGTPPIGRCRPTAVYDEAANRMVVFGGSRPNKQFADAFALDLTPGAESWAKLTSPDEGGPKPAPRSAYAAANDPSHGRILYYGGWHHGGSYTDTWAFRTTTPIGWEAVDTSGTGPPRYGHAMVVDAAHNRIVSFGGFENQFLRNDTRMLSLTPGSEWEVLEPSGGTPPPMFSPTAVVDEPRDRMLLHGGPGTLWALNLTGSPVWTAVTAIGPAPALRSHSSVYDPVRDRMLIFGGASGNFQNPVYHNRLWAFSFATSTWTEIVPIGATPEPRQGAGVAYDSSRDRLLVYGGSGPASYDDVWELPLTEPPQWIPLWPVLPGPGPRNSMQVFYDAPQDRLVLFGGGYVQVLDDTWFLNFGTVADVAPEPGEAGKTTLRVTSLFPNPSSDQVRVSFTLPRTERVKITVWDVTGRQVLASDLGVLTAGVHRHELGRLRELPVGIYALRISTRTGAAESRVCLMR